jgi:hypothetical protein
MDNPALPYGLDRVLRSGASNPTAKALRKIFARFVRVTH